MKPHDAEGYRHIREIYDLVPPIQCKGLCHNSCTSIEVTDLEAQVIRDRHGINFPPRVPSQQLKEMRERGQSFPRCPALGPLNNCRIYADRPLICRLYGADAAVPCEYGCVPEGGKWLAVETGTAMLHTAKRVSDETLGG